MKKEDMHVPDDFASLEGKLRVVDESLAGLLAGSEAFRLRRDAVEWMAAATASLIILHQVVAAMLEDQVQ
jgi:hypothetical protein